jgi:uncharacterized damage-inducible protein DinB
MSEPNKPSVWLRGDVSGVPGSLQPVAHGLLNMLEEVEEAVAPLSQKQLWQSVNGAASVGFHLRHLAGSTSRLFTYARGDQLSEDQRSALAAEKSSGSTTSSEELLRNLRQVVDDCLAELGRIHESELDLPRPVGRAAFASTVRGILHHAAEHAARHSGQVITTAKIVSNLS